MTDREQIRRERRQRIKDKTAWLADYAEDSADGDDVDQIRAEVIALFDAALAELEQAERERDEAVRILSTNAGLRQEWEQAQK